MPQSSYNVLVVDDNDSIHHDIRALLRSRAELDDLDTLAGELLGTKSRQHVQVPTYHLDSFYQGQDAVRAIEQGKAAGRQYALALVDMRMPPGWNGVKTIQRIWETDADVQVAICSAYSDYGWEELVEELGVSDKLLFLRKPFDPHALRQLVLSLTTRWNRERELRKLLRSHEHMLTSYETELRELRKQVAGEPVQDLLVQAALRTASHARRAAGAEAVEVALDALMDVLHALHATQLSGEQRAMVAQAIRSGSALRALLTTIPARNHGTERPPYRRSPPRGADFHDGDPAPARDVAPAARADPRLPLVVRSRHEVPVRCPHIARLRA